MRTKWVMGLLIAALASVGHDRMSRQIPQKAVLVSSAPPPALILPLGDVAAAGDAPVETLRCQLNSFSLQAALPGPGRDRLRFAF